MNRKLTLKLDEEVIDRAKKYAEINRESVSGLVERYLKVLTETMEKNRRIKGTTTREISGVISLPENYDEKQDYRNSKGL